MILTINTAPASEPVTLAEAKAHLRVDTSDDDAYITSLIPAARQQVEAMTNRGLVEQIWDYYIDRFPYGDYPIELPRAPLSSVGSIKYTDENGTEQTLSASTYTVDTDSEPGRIYLAYNKSWPSTRTIRKAVHITFTAGYAPGSGSPTDYAENVPDSIKHAILLLVGHLYENRESVVTGTIVTKVPGFDALISPYKVWTL